MQVHFKIAFKMIKIIHLAFLISFLSLTRAFSKIPVNIPELISRADLYYDKPVTCSEEGMPVGNGRMGSLVWTTPVIILFPAWPEEWDAEFRLLARGNFLVTASFTGSIIGNVELISGNGSDCRLVNPWPGSSVIIYRNGEKSGTLKGNLLIFSTKRNEKIMLEISGH